jgi:hypothetical protein
MASARRDNSTAADVMTVQQERHSILDARQHVMSVCTTMMKGQSTVQVSTRKKCLNPKVWMMTRSGFEDLFLLNFFGVDICKLIDCFLVERTLLPMSRNLISYGPYINRN